MSQARLTLVVMLELRADPWAATHGQGAEIPFGDQLEQPVSDPTVETSDWSRPLEPRAEATTPVTFVDGVMRTDLHVLARDGEARAWGLFGSYAAGAVQCDGTARFVAEDEPVGRAFILGGRMNGSPFTVEIGGCALTFEPRTMADDDPQAHRRALQRLMIEAEQRLAASLGADGMVFADGPLHFNSGADALVVGVVKRMVASYLGPEHGPLLPLLEPGQRTPLIALGSTVLDRFSWYVRLIPSERQWHELAGLVRCDVRMELGLERAVAIADRVAATLPQFAGRPGVDPRAPQNLTPVGALEGRLKGRLGHAGIVRRALESRLMEDLVA
jgi:uncharacterized protein